MGHRITTFVAIFCSSILAVAADTRLGQHVREADTLNTSTTAFPAGFLRVSDEPHQIFYDPFDAALDTTNRWTAATTAGAGSAAVTTGNLAIGSGTTASGYANLGSQASMVAAVPGWLGVSSAIKLTDGAAPTANTYRFWGAGTTPATPTTALPLTDAYGFEIDTAGKMYAVVYGGGTRTLVQDLSTSGNSKQPTDALYHRYIVYYRTDKIYFYIDGLDANSLVATANLAGTGSTVGGPQVQTLPVRFLSIAASSAPAASGVINCTGVAVWDTAKNNSTISDGTYGFRKLTVSSTGAASVAVTSAIPTGANTIGAVTQASGPWTSNITQIGGTAVLSGGTAGSLGIGGLGVAGTPSGGVLTVQGATTGTALPSNLTQINGSAAVTAATGTLKVGIVGNAGGALDTTNNGTVPANVVADGAETIASTTNPTAATTGNMRRLLGSTEGVLYVREGGSNPFSCVVPITATATTQCQAAPAAGLRAYVTSVTASNGAATVQGVDIVYGTGAACVTGTTALTHKFQMGTNATTTSPFLVTATFPTPLVPPAANAICVRPTAATAFGATITGYIAP